MKKTAFCFMATCLSLTFYPLRSNATTAETSSSSVVSKSIEAAEAKVLLQRLYEIDAMDKSNLKASDKKNLRNEVLSIKHKLSAFGGGIFISVGAILLILLLLIILL